MSINVMFHILNISYLITSHFLNFVSYLIMSFKCRVCVSNFVSYLIIFHYFKSFRVQLFFIFKLFRVKVSNHVRYRFYIVLIKCCIMSFHIYLFTLNVLSF